MRQNNPRHKPRHGRVSHPAAACSFTSLAAILALAACEPSNVYEGSDDTDDFLTSDNPEEKRNETFHGRAGNDTILAGAGNDTLNGDEGDDTLYGESGDDSLHGGTQNDRLSAGSGNDVLHGDEGDDYLTGGSGNDTMNGGSGNDTFFADSGNDAISGGSGYNRLLLPFSESAYFDGFAAGANTLTLSDGEQIIADANGHFAGTLTVGATSIVFSGISEFEFQADSPVWSESHSREEELPSTVAVQDEAAADGEEATDEDEDAEQSEEAPVELTPMPHAEGEEDADEADEYDVSEGDLLAETAMPIDEWLG